MLSACVQCFVVTSGLFHTAVDELELKDAVVIPNEAITGTHYICTYISASYCTYIYVQLLPHVDS